MLWRTGATRAGFSTRRAKTDTLYKIRLSDRVLQIIDKYKPEDNKGIIFRKVQCNSKYNKQLRKAMVLCGITRRISLHMARHTFAGTVALNNGMPTEIVSSLLGYQSLQSMQIYTKHRTLSLSDDLEKLEK